MFHLQASCSGFITVYATVLSCFKSEVFMAIGIVKIASAGLGASGSTFEDTSKTTGPSLWRGKLVWKRNMCRCFICRFHVVVLSLFMQQEYFLASNLSSSGHIHVHSLFTNEEQKRKVGSCPNWHSATHSDLVHDVTDTDCQTQNGSVLSHLCLHNFQMLIFVKPDYNHDNGEKKYCKCFLFVRLFLLSAIGPMMLLHSGPALLHRAMPLRLSTRLFSCIYQQYVCTEVLPFVWSLSLPSTLRWLVICKFTQDNNFIWPLCASKC